MGCALQWDAREETYLDVKRMLDKLAKRLYVEYGKAWVTRVCGHYDEVRSQADYLFMVAYETFSPEMGTSFSTWTYIKVWKGLLEHMRRSASKMRRYADVDLDFEAVPRPVAEFDLTDFMAGLPEDAREVVRLLCVETPTDVYLAMAQKRLDTPAAMRTALREYLKDVGWASARITESFKEVAEALRG